WVGTHQQTAEMWMDADESHSCTRRNCSCPIGMGHLPPAGLAAACEVSVAPTFRSASAGVHALATRRPEGRRYFRTRTSRMRHRSEDPRIPLLVCADLESTPRWPAAGTREVGGRKHCAC